jgi:hypothetical protein
MKITPFFRWYDLWVGAYWDRKARTLYVCPLPTIGVALRFGPESTSVEGDIRALVDMSTRDREVRVWRTKEGRYGARLGRAPIVDFCPSLDGAARQLREIVESEAERGARKRGVA